MLSARKHVTELQAQLRDGETRELHLQQRLAAAQAAVANGSINNDNNHHAAQAMDEDDDDEQDEAPAAPAAPKRARKAGKVKVEKAKIAMDPATMSIAEIKKALLELGVAPARSGLKAELATQLRDAQKK